jgi:hypothetical protein
MAIHGSARARLSALLTAAVLAGAALAAQEREREVPKDSERISIPGCARNRTFIVGEPAEHEPVRSDIAPGRRFRLNGPKKLLDEIRLRQAYMVEITGLVRKGQLAGPGGVSIAGGRIRIGGQQPQVGLGDPTRQVPYNEVVIDVESWRPLSEACPER